MNANIDVIMGALLRKRVESWCKATKSSRRALSIKIGCEPNYLSSYLSRRAEDWALPKHTTYLALLEAIGVSQDEMEADAKATDPLKGAA